MRTPLKILLLTAAATAIAAAPRSARAQADVDPPLPNVLLLVDNSGSMEYLVAPDAAGKNQLPGSVPGSECDGGTKTTVLNRWATLVTVLTGQINNFSCLATPRNGEFITEYTYQGVPPYDREYFLPFHRLLSDDCTPGPGVLPTNWWEWPDNAINYHESGNPSKACGVAGFSQATDGILDTFRDRVRFGVMTFDTFADPGVGISSNSPDMVSGVKGMWSYFPNWPLGGGTSKTGNLPSCAPIPFEVGARNQAAPPWEGRFIPFGPGDAPLADVQITNDHIQEALLALRPYGATPIAGMFDDAREFLLNDTTIDPSTSKPFGPSQDPFVKGGCRKTSIILLSDGEPNMDLRPECETGDGVCPYLKVDEIAEELASLPGNSRIQTYVVGLGVSDPPALASLGLTSCAQLDPTKDCANPPAGLKSCCALTRIAEAGGTGHAYFADDLLGLKAQLSAVVAGIAAGSTARTVPVFSDVVTTGTQGSAGAAGYRFVSRFKADTSGRLWSGQLDRERYVCTSQGGKLVATLQEPDPAAGDDFAADLNSNTPARKFFTFAAPLIGTQILSGSTIRPNIILNDGLGTYAKGALPMPLMEGSLFATTIKGQPELLGMNPSSPPLPCSTTLKASTASQCAELLVRWEIGENNPSLPDTRDASSCPVSGTCSEFGSIYHSTPAVVGPPQDTIRDDSYVKFISDQGKRPTVLYTASTDGQLHAFKVAANDPADSAKVDKLENNELWAFLPPVVLPNLLSSYNQQALLTDGAPVTADVVYERRRSKPVTWNTVLVAAGGTAGGFYYALDITDPKDPKFLWQLSTDENGTGRLFGRTTPRPAIATVTIPDGTDIKQVAVAILAGGTSSTLPDVTCARDNAGSLMKSKSGQYLPRTEVHCWAQPGAARSLTIVRLDTGEVLMNFRAAATNGPPGLTDNSQVVKFSAPISGIPVPFPAQTGQVADRIYVGDADGALWRIDLSGGDPKKWTAKLAWDAYSLTGDDAQISEPVQTAPVISTNAIGDTVIIYSTGDQDLLSPSATMKTRLWSLVETRDAVNKSFNVSESDSTLFPKDFTGGERVTGPMALFASVLYFSTFNPSDSGLACSFGGSAVWAIDFQTGAARFPDPVKPGTFKEFEPAPNTIIFGVSVTQTPTCSEASCEPDPFFGTNCSVNVVDGGDYQVVWQKGVGNGVTDNSLVTTTPDGIQSLTLQSPRQSTRIDSWAGIIE
jgi:type IV pilus assembly protein PilY1